MFANVLAPSPLTFVKMHESGRMDISFLYCLSGVFLPLAGAIQIAIKQLGECSQLTQSFLPNIKHTVGVMWVGLAFC